LATMFGDAVEAAARVEAEAAVAAARATAAAAAADAPAGTDAAVAAADWAVAPAPAPAAGTDTAVEANAFGPDEAWLNVLRPGGWNQLHTHPGCAFAGSYYVSDGRSRQDGGGGSGASDAARLAGKLVLIPSAPPQLSDQGVTHLVPSAPGERLQPIPMPSPQGFSYLLLVSRAVRPISPPVLAVHPITLHRLNYEAHHPIEPRRRRPLFPTLGAA